MTQILKYLFVIFITILATHSLTLIIHEVTHLFDTSSLGYKPYSICFDYGQDNLMHINFTNTINQTQANALENKAYYITSILSFILGVIIMYILLKLVIQD
jgi:hypothetical protein